MDYRETINRKEGIEGIGQREVTDGSDTLKEVSLPRLECISGMH